MRRLLFLGVLLIGACGTLRAQSTNASLTGYITDPAKAIIVGAKIIAINVDTNIRYEGTTNNAGDYDVTNLPPGKYRIEVEKPGFKTVVKSDVILHVQDTIAINFEMVLGSVSEIVTVEGGAPVINTTDASVSTVVDRQFAENLPLNGRSFQTLIQLTPGVVLTQSSNSDNGQFSVNGQRAASNYWMVDGVSANIGIGSTNFSAGNGLSGAMPSFSALGGTNSLVSVDALQEFRIQTSTYAPEFGRTPGGQISIVTRSGTNAFHGTLFDYLRNDILDANNWFADRDGLPKPEERQNDFGGTFSGPINKNRTFFFFSYEGLRLRLPEIAESLVPDLSFRQNAIPAIQPFLNAFPLPSPGTPDDTTNGIAHFNTAFSNQAALDAYSLRIDHKLSEKMNLFARYNYSPSSLTQRGGLGGSLNSVVPTEIKTQTATLGATFAVSARTINDVRFNYSRTNSSSSARLDSTGGAVPPSSLPFPSPFTTKDSFFQFYIGPLLPFAQLNVGPQGHNIQRQINVVDNVSAQRGSHGIKFGVDIRRLSPFFGNPAYSQQLLFDDVPSAAAGNVSFAFITSGRSGTIRFYNLGAFAQDTWRIKPRVTVTYGLRWDVDFAPYSNLGYVAVTGFNLNDLSQLALAPAGTPPFKTQYGNFAPRVGVAYQLSQNQRWQSVLRGGFGVFYDLATSEVGNTLNPFAYPFGAFSFTSGTYPLSPAAVAPPPITRANLQDTGVYASDPNLKLPYTRQWNFSIDQALGVAQTLSATYSGAAGRRLIQTAYVNSPNPNFASAQLVTNAATSDYDALQLQFQRRLSRGLQTLASYTWSHSIDTASAASLYGNTANAFLPNIANSNRASSDFDIRHAFTAGITYEVPAPKINAFTNAILRGWSLQNVIQARSAPPVTVFDGQFFFLRNDYAQIRPDIVPGQPFYLYGPQYPGRKAFNPAAFTDPPLDSSGDPLRQGNLPRNALRSFGAAQWDFAVHRDFAIRESLKLQFRAEMFNVLNHPSFAPNLADLSNQTQFGQSTQTLGQYLAGGNVGSGGFSPLYQIGGPRSVQLALKFQF